MLVKENKEGYISLLGFHFNGSFSITEHDDPEHPLINGGKKYLYDFQGIITVNQRNKYYVLKGVSFAIDPNPDNRYIYISFKDGFVVEHETLQDITTIFRLIKSEKYFDMFITKFEEEIFKELK